ncbi:MAG: DUF2183 domain-containing protein [Propionibacterium sp.]|nr:DUF2183 domain-containing protein [Propionibacterium sp.]
MARPFFAARLEEKLNSFIGSVLRRRGWRESIIPYTGYGTTDFVRVMARLVLVPPGATYGSANEPLMRRRGWRNFFTAPVAHAKVSVSVNGTTSHAMVDRNGYLDLRIETGLEPGWREVSITCRTGSAQAPIMVVDPDAEFGLISDIDDTVITTMLPRIWIAAWNTFVAHESARQPVPGMADMYRRLLTDRPDAPVFYVSTGAWNTAGTLARFLKHEDFPPGPLMLTDWGPTNTGWFRSGQEHKRTALRQLAIDLPRVQWLLVGDDGQHDPGLYREFAAKFPDKVVAIALRQLSPVEQLLAHGTTTAIDDGEPVEQDAQVVQAPDGHGLWPRLSALLGSDTPSAERP